MSTNKISVIAFRTISRPPFKAKDLTDPTTGQGWHYMQRDGETYCGAQGTDAISHRRDPASSNDVTCEECRKGAIDFENGPSDRDQEEVGVGE